jgi:hypothetical protein
MRPFFLVLSLLCLTGCVSSSVATAELDDDASCKRIVAERGGSYDQCRENLMTYRRNKAIAAGGR